MPISDYVKDYSNKFGSAYLKPFVSAPYKYYESLLPTPTTPNSRFLDLGCEGGHHSIYPAKLGYHVTGVDLQAEFLECAKVRAREFNVAERCDFLLAEGKTYLDNAEPFDVIFLSGSLYHFNLAEIMPKILDTLKPGGHFFCVETYGENKIISLLRSRHKPSRTRDGRELSSLLKKNDIKFLSTFFPKHDVKYFDLFTLGVGTVIEPMFNSRPLLGMAERIDSVVLNSLKLNALSFKFVFHGQKN